MSRFVEKPLPPKKTSIDTDEEEKQDRFRRQIDVRKRMAASKSRKAAM